MSGEDRWVVGQIYTGRRVVESFVVENGRVVAAGSRRATRRARPTGAERSYVDRCVVVPGLVDPHVHPVHITLDAGGVNLHGVRSIEEMLGRARGWAQDHPHGPVVGRGWDQERFSGRQYPTRVDLARLGVERPVVLYRLCSHVAVVNDQALEILGVDSLARDYRRGRVGRDSSGRPNGLLFEEALRPLRPIVDRAVFAWPGALRKSLETARRVGLTTLAPLNASSEEVRWGFEEAAKGKLPVRLRYYLDVLEARRIPGLVRSPNPAWARLSGVKALLDGSFGAHTAWLRSPYADRPTETGVSAWGEEELARALSKAVRFGLGLALHAIGDAALELALRLIEKHPGLRPVRIEHAALTPTDLLARLSALPADLVVQPGFVARDDWIVDRLGPSRARSTYAFRTLLRSHLRVAGSSDAPVEPLDPLAGMRIAVRRAPFRLRLESGGADQRLSPREALHMYSAAGGEVLGEPDLGTLDPGSVADWTVLRGASIDAAIEGPKAGVAETWIDGECVYRQPGLPRGFGAPKL